ncbi:CPXCG motif-containing cysteine-rich protein [Mangrovitalea sediminis]|uniref:CPXCG motif-containing cysteine-rich protein n=1 Tax=Mangrovitalea sediminis TaxID=1982043 RepID=UPI0018EA1FCA|nr:CPXCG motif-containing cysteine-rich protein [Mangrovitalea sediminis]
MSLLTPFRVQCPYCWETIEVLLDPSEPSQSYIEDCQVCCHPIQFRVEIDESGIAQVDAQREDD